MKAVPAANHGGSQSTVTRIVIHATVSPCKRGGALSVAQFFAKQTTKASAHYVVDPGEIVRCLPEDVVGWHAPPNTGSIGIELCDPQAGADLRWADADHEAMLELAAGLVRRVAERWHVPLVRLSAADLKAGKHGICGHVDVSQAFHQTDHTDPGKAFPWAHFMGLVRGDDPDTHVPPPAAPDEFKGDLRITSPLMRGEHIRRWQTRAAQWGENLAADGVYGPISAAACSGIQRRIGMPETGVVDAETWLLTWIWES